MRATDQRLIRDKPEPLGRPDQTVDSLGEYLTAIGTTPLLTAAQEVDLAKRIEAGVYAKRMLDSAADSTQSPQRLADLRAVARDGAAAMDVMVRSNLRLVVSVAARCSRGFLPLVDLIQEGNIGLIRAVQKFDYTKGYRFSTYATWWIRQSIERAIAKTGRAIHIPVHVTEEIARFDRVARKLRTELGHEPTAVEIADAAHVTVRQINEFHAVARPLVSLDSLIYGEPQLNLGDLVADPDAPDPGERVESDDIVRRVRKAVDGLPRDASAVIKLRYGLTGDRSCARQEAASRLGLTYRQAEQLERTAMRRLRRGELKALASA
ncbi:MAG TPA: sigma-70 family RNA polymerase sigma factor [Pseudonocardiaceae bacterium]|jgi:RNA polymerase sigma factor (sigma-70 family)|nr:sigma-70 family RNA polymerase sigma factor [Pseudonocardiaceae bacterium]